MSTLSNPTARKFDGMHDIENMEKHTLSNIQVHIGSKNTIRQGWLPQQSKISYRDCDSPQNLTKAWKTQPDLVLLDMPV